MGTSQLFDWPTAKAALNAGWRVRRSGWNDRWLERWTGGLIWIIRADNSKHVVQNSDFGSGEFNALDWTNLPPECVTQGTTAGTGTNGCPLPYDPNTNTDSDTGSQTTTPPTPVPPDDTPSGGFGAGQTGAGGGGGGGGGGGNSTSTRRSPQNTTWPSLELFLEDAKTDCYDHGADEFVKPVFTGWVKLSQPSGYNGPGVFCVSVKNGPSTVATCTLSPGNLYEIAWHDPLNANPGSTLTFTARAWAYGAPDLQSSYSATLKGWCCAPPGCCPGEDGHQCGDGCCCCPAYYAPNGPNCECIYVG